MKSATIRQAFLSYFANHQHKIMPSSSLIPQNDPSLLFTNAGMNQFKDVFLGQQPPPYPRAASAQRCLRAGGKHNDLENVGYTARHHTFFEMLGNFSFGDYFKEEAINLAWTFLTQHLLLDPEKLLITVYAEDKETYAIWCQKIGVPEERIICIGDQGGRYVSDNFWSMGNTGPCGPCSEIFYDHGAHIPGGQPGSAEEDGDRFVEIWNIVFMQYNKNTAGELVPLPKPAVDTGMGLERIAAVMQGVQSNYEIDIFQSIMAKIAEVLHLTEKNSTATRIIADHIRASTFLIADGVMPANEGQGYVLRRIIRRAIRQAHILGARQSFFYSLVPTVIEVMGDVGIDLRLAQNTIEQTLKREEENFATTLDRGLAILKEILKKTPENQLPGASVFLLYDTYGFPVDLTAEIVKEKGYSIDYEAFERLMEEQKKRARQAHRFSVNHSTPGQKNYATFFSGYKEAEVKTHIYAIFVAGKPAEMVSNGQSAELIVSKTPFYAEAGGQVSDQGDIIGAQGIFVVEDCQKIAGNIVQLGRMQKGVLRVGETVTARINTTRRQQIAANHSATHLLHSALRAHLGKNVVQKGSLVDDQRLRFDFSYPQSLQLKDIEAVEALVNEKIRANSKVLVAYTEKEKAQEQGAIALFGEKYASKVRVVSMGNDNFSTELCGGTHVTHTGDIGIFLIISETGIAAGVRRIEAVTGLMAEKKARACLNTIKSAENQLKTQENRLAEKISSLLLSNRQLEKKVDDLNQQLITQHSKYLAGGSINFPKVKFLCKNLANNTPKTLRLYVDQIKEILGCSIVILVSQNADRYFVVIGVSKNLTTQIKANELLENLLAKVGGKGGGRSDFAQGSCDNHAQLSKALDALQVNLKKLLEKIA